MNDNEPAFYRCQDGARDFMGSPVLIVPLFSNENGQASRSLPAPPHIIDTGQNLWRIATRATN